MLQLARFATVTAAITLVCASSCAHDARSGERTVSTQRERVAAARFASPYTYEWFIRAELLRGQGQLPAAIEAYRIALSDADEDAYVLARLGSALAEHGEDRAAAAAVERALELEPGSEAGWLARALLSERRGDSEAMLGALERAEQAEPLSPRAPLRLSAWLRQHGHPERAQAVLLRFEARSLAGTRRAQLVRLQHALATRDPDQVFAATAPFRLFGVRAPEPLTEAARQLFERSRPAEALRIIELVPETPNESTLRLKILEACGRWPAVEGWLLLHDASDHDDRLELARAQLVLNRPDVAAQILDAERLQGFDDSASQLLAADVDLANGAYASAADRYSRVTGSRGQRAARDGVAHALVGAGLAALADEVTSGEPSPVASAGTPDQ